MPGSKYNRNPGVPATRVERLLRERGLRKINRGINSGDENLDDEERQEEVATEVANSYGDRCGREDGRPVKQRLLVVANRLPVSAIRKGKDSWSLEISAGGLVSALLGVKQFETKWIGWAGVNVPDENGQQALTKALAEKRCIPVFLDEDIVHQYYNGYCNNILWPLFHYLGLPQEDRLATTRSFQSQFDAYKKANQMFADVVNEHYQEGDVVWCHDYHLMFLPKYLKERNSQMKVGWFLHTPFPSSEIHRTLPSRSELLRSVLAADLVGFHTYDYARHFVSACTRILGLEGTPQGVEDQGKLTRVAAFPIGIDPERFIRALELPPVQEHIRELKERFAGRKVMLGVDRLDMIKGIPQKILAFEKFLEENPHWRDKVVLLQIAVPTRTDVPEYQRLTSQVHEIVGRINGRFGTLTAVPIHHLDRSLDFHALCALYAITDVALVTSLRDGMNLVSYEFVACQDAKKGVLILSEFAGAAQSLGAGALLVNPWNITEVAASIGQALDMPADEREKRHKHNFQHVTTHTAQVWAETFVSELNDTVVEAQLRTRQIPPSLPIKTAVERYLHARNRLLILGFNATLTSLVDSPGRRGADQIKEMELTLHPDLKVPLTILCSDPRTTMVVLSGSDRNILDLNFGDYHMWLAAENGMFLRLTQGEWMTTMPEHLNMDWVESVQDVFEYFTERTPRSYVEVRETSLVWNYKYADVEFGRLQARDMLQHLWTGPISNAAVDVVQGSRSVEVRSVGVSKGAAIDRILGEIVHSKSLATPIDYVLCIGHFLGKDEDIYTFFEPELPCDAPGTTRGKVTESVKTLPEKRSMQKTPGKSGGKPMHGRTNKLSSFSEKRTSGSNSGSCRGGHETAAWREGSSVLDLKGENYFSCAVGRKRSAARYLLSSSEEVVSFLKEMAGACEVGEGQCAYFSRLLGGRRARDYGNAFI
ncbi:alpha,alpha-trehalose-phosphate synthase [UDP-forming] 1-like isoform X1 [Nymphaea colorata]|nr:alpha,alpha-trehalose-phosphate synthase [UDP-forming] 1-like isoform X1 [Nymphaea colorata]XP_031488285.1 alpha,alpha-trehalose-phosphate synthase [UDP-forming] 1-like isoform X1 [Nymphaea colorata]XP_031488292.1 alpha,alpha-trehalose-phosphate synthase [UDP-forming] 1-like isoform X1 [Nymphaea colorata]XP_031488301.1 alpha,alpha-trehalose-phosphate synthase [UDP-forming] 1-like isoform X1 [Nymphaea colorata]